jgi:hypothetical protein
MAENDVETNPVTLDELLLMLQNFKNKKHHAEIELIKKALLS